MNEVSKSTPAPELLAVAYRALTAEEQELAYELINQVRLQRLAGENSEFGQLVASLKAVADVLGEAPGIDDYKRVRRELEAEGQTLEPPSRPNSSQALRACLSHFRSFRSHALARRKTLFCGRNL